MSMYIGILSPSMLMLISAPYFISEQLPTVPSCSTCGSFNSSTRIHATLAKDSVIPVIVLPESQSVHALRLLISTQVARHLLSSSEYFSHILVFLDGIGLCFQVFILFNV